MTLLRDWGMVKDVVGVIESWIRRLEVFRLLGQGIAPEEVDEKSFAG
jgi:hypothetical protein